MSGSDTSAPPAEPSSSDVFDISGITNLRWFSPSVSIRKSTMSIPPRRSNTGQCTSDSLGSPLLGANPQRAWAHVRSLFTRGRIGRSLASLAAKGLRDPSLARAIVGQARPCWDPQAITPYLSYHRGVSSYCSIASWAITLASISSTVSGSRWMPGNLSRAFISALQIRRGCGIVRMGVLRCWGFWSSVRDRGEGGAVCDGSSPVWCC